MKTAIVCYEKCEPDAVLAEVRGPYTEHGAEQALPKLRAKFAWAEIVPMRLVMTRKARFS